jgi:hypothetical protein
MVVFAQHYAREGRQYFSATGEADYLERTVLAITLYLRKKRSDLTMTTRVSNKRFELSFDVDKKIFPGYYEVRAQFVPHLQVDPDLLDLQTEPANMASFSLRVGSEEEITEVRKQLLVFYKKALEAVKKTYNRMRDLYIQITRGKKFDIATASKEWADTTMEMLQEFDRDVRAYRAAYQDYIVPIFPQLHGCIGDMQISLMDVTGDMGFAVSTDLAAEGAGGKVLTHEDVLAACDRQMNAMFGSVDGQLLLEEKEELRDLLLNQLRQLAWLNDCSWTFFDRCLARKTRGQFNSNMWSENLRNWRQQMEGLAVAMQVHKDTEIQKRNPRAIKLMFEMPRHFENVWKLYDASLLEGKDVASQLAPMRCRLQADIVDLIGTFEFSDEFGPGGRWPELAKFALTDEAQLKEKATRCLLDLKSKDNAIRLKAFKMLAGMPTDLVSRHISEGVNYGDDALYRNACVILTALHGIDSHFDRLCKLLGEEKNSEFRAFTARAIGRLGKEQGVPPLCNALINDESEVVRGMCADSLGQLGVKAGIDALINALNDKAEDVRIKAHFALMTLSADIETIPLFFPEASAEARKYYVAEIRKWWEQAKQKLEQQPPPTPEEPKNE